MCFVNMNDKPIEINFDWKKHDTGDGLNDRNLNTKKDTYTIKDLFNHKNLKGIIGVHDCIDDQTRIKIESLDKSHSIIISNHLSTLLTYTILL